MLKVILIEDDLEISSLLEEFLALYDMELTSFSKPHDALEMLRVSQFDIAIVDIGLPQMSGFELCRQIVSLRDMPIIIFSARDSLSDKLRALELGADDYVVKTVEPIELVARIKAVMRRYKKDEAIPLFMIQNEQILKNGVDLDLTKSEYMAMSFFMQNKGHVISKEILSEHLGLEYGSRGVDMLISRLRQKIEEDAKTPKYLKLVWGMGYKLTC